MAGLTRGENDSYFHQVKALIDSGHNNPKYEQIWRVLGEMVRYGDIFLNIEAAGKTADIFHVDQFRALNDNDLIKSNRRFLGIV
ncbi:MAG: hypothetical protein HWD59_04555 [Coxiellaceae bacterium]|nr:MAG: hypothetical protein HWD59_04555 [Coxiellaceae bacterium]